MKADDERVLEMWRRMREAFPEAVIRREMKTDNQKALEDLRVAIRPGESFTLNGLKRRMGSRAVREFRGDYKPETEDPLPRDGVEEKIDLRARQAVSVGILEGIVEDRGAGVYRLKNLEDTWR